MSAISTHCRSWVGDEGPELLTDQRVMFGCRAAANYAQRGSGFLAWVAQQALDRMNPCSPKIERAFELISKSAAARANPQAVRFRQAFVTQFIDDLPALAVESAADTSQSLCAAVWDVLGVKPQPKKVWPEGGFGKH